MHMERISPSVTDIFTDKKVNIFFWSKYTFTYIRFTNYARY